MPTETQVAQRETEQACQELLTEPPPPLAVDNHVRYLTKMLGSLPFAFRSLDASRPWLIYWPVNGLALLDVGFADFASTVLACQSPQGGFGGGIGQPPHLAASYAAILALAHADDPQVWQQIDRKSMYSFLKSVKNPDGSFRVCKHGESDPRGTYTALTIANLLDIVTDELLENVGSYISSCQTYEGGIANQPGGEAHGGYAFCALATLFYLNEPPSKHLNIDLFISWLVQRQYATEGGFSGRTNKLVDGCYSHWAGGCWALLEQLVDGDLWSREALVKYVLCCCQSDNGGLRDKPGCPPDAYHSNYVLAGLSGAAYRYRQGNSIYEWGFEKIMDLPVKPINPLFVLPLGVGEKMHRYFKST